MKKFLLILLAGTMLVGLCACNPSKNPVQNTDNKPTPVPEDVISDDTYNYIVDNLSVDKLSNTIMNIVNTFPTPGKTLTDFFQGQPVRPNTLFSDFSELDGLFRLTYYYGDKNALGVQDISPIGECKSDHIHAIIYDGISADSSTSQILEDVNTSVEVQFTIHDANKAEELYKKLYAMMSVDCVNKTNSEFSDKCTDTFNLPGGALSNGDVISPIIKMHMEKITNGGDVYAFIIYHYYAESALAERYNAF